MIETVEITCELCGNHTFLCNCDRNWVTFDKVLHENCNGITDITNNVKYTDISISTMTICFNFTKLINLTLLKESLPENMIKYNPGCKKSKVQKKKGTDSFYNSFDIKLTFVDRKREPFVFSNVSIFIFPNGRAKAAGIKTINTIYIMLEELINIITSVPDCTDPDISTENVKIQMICSDFKIKPIIENPDGWCLKQEDLKNILVNEYSKSATFSALSRYPGINLKIQSTIEPLKQISVLIFRSGSIIITGAKNASDIANCYQFIIGVISSHSVKLFYYDINEELKQKKKK
uniref:TATA-box binding protein n=1 Tax=viral metagenome TaxID=1070528 RepID=A0A6C0I8S7_9ZZZZ